MDSQKMNISNFLDNRSNATLSSRVEKTHKLRKINLSPFETSVQFLRGVYSRSVFILPAFYYLLGSAHEPKSSRDLSFADEVSRNYIQLSALNTITIFCRNIFDDDRKCLTGNLFSKKLNSEVLQKHSEFWADKSNLSYQEAESALVFLKSFFQATSKQTNVLLAEKSLLCKRIALIKRHASIDVAHLSLDPYEFDLHDLAHISSCICIIGEIIRYFDDSESTENYFTDLDMAAQKATKKMFPEMSSLTLFNGLNIESHAKCCWKYDREEGLEMLQNQLPNAISWF